MSEPAEPEEETAEQAAVPPRTEIAQRRVRIVLATLVLIVIAATLVIWGLTR